MNIPLPQEMMQVLAMLQDHGYEAYAVGGCVRDFLLGKQPLDWDITTNALPEEIISCFRDCTLLKTSVRHGTVTVLWKDVPYEITTYRSETGYGDHRHPDQVQFVPDLREDLKRRDFTINAMAYHPQRGLIDLFQGQDDLRSGSIRAIGEAKERFSEDALRILRALRFSAVLGFSIVEETALQIHQMAEDLAYVAKERIFVEWKKLLCGKAADMVLVEYADVWAGTVMQLSRTTDAAKMMPYLPCDFTLRTVAVFLCEDFSVEQASSWMKQWKYDGKTIRAVCELLELYQNELPKTAVQLNKLLLGRTTSDFAKVLLLHKAWELAFASRESEALLQAEELFERVCKEDLCLSVHDLAISGRDLLEVGIPAGKKIGDCLQFLLLEIAEKRVVNQKEALLNVAKNVLLEIDHLSCDKNRP